MQREKRLSDAYAVHFAINHLEDPATAGSSPKAAFDKQNWVHSQNDAELKRWLKLIEVVGWTYWVFSELHDDVAARSATPGHITAYIRQMFEENYSSESADASRYYAMYQAMSLVVEQKLLSFPFNNIG